VRGKRFGVDVHEQTLPNRCRRLLLGDGAWTPRQVQRVHASADGPGRDQNNAAPRVKLSSDLLGQTGDVDGVRRSTAARESAGADFDDDFAKGRNN